MGTFISKVCGAKGETLYQAFRAYHLIYTFTDKTVRGGYSVFGRQEGLFDAGYHYHERRETDPEEDGGDKGMVQERGAALQEGEGAAKDAVDR